MQGIGYILIAVVCLSVHLLALKLLGHHLPATLVTLCFYTVGLVFLMGLHAIINPSFQWAELYNLKVLALLALAGISIALVDFFFMTGLTHGAPIAFASPLLLAGSSLLVVVIGMAFLSEAFTATKLVGIAAALIGIFLINKG